ncbi:MAG: hypothetical protein ACTSU2_01470 [Promethearchaeota archaeon]
MAEKDSQNKEDYDKVLKQKRDPKIEAHSNSGSDIQSSNIPQISIQEAYKWAFISKFILYFGWFIVIYGFIGHICPFAFVAIWALSLTACYAFTGKRPRFLGIFISFILTLLMWGFTFFYLHPNNVFGWKVDHPSRNITILPFLGYFLNLFIVFYTQIIIAKKLPTWKRTTSSRFESILDEVFAVFSMIISIIGGLYYIIWGKSSWNNSEQEWYDTIFRVGDVYYLFLYIAIVALISGFSFLAYYLLKLKDYIEERKTKQNKGGTIVTTVPSITKDIDKKIKRLIILKLIGYSMVEMLIIGVWGVFVYSGKNESNYIKHINEKYNARA